MSALATCKKCGAAYYLGDWLALPFVGYQPIDGARIEQRNCPCTSTLGVVVEEEGVPWTLAGELADVFRNDANQLEGRPSPYAWPPKKRRTPTESEVLEANRLHDIADELMARVRAWHSPEAA